MIELCCSNQVRLWVRITLLSLKLQIWRLLQARSSLISRQTIECGFPLKLVRDMIITYSQMHRTDNYSQQLNHLASLAKWLSVRLQTKWFRVGTTLRSLKLQTSLNLLTLNTYRTFF